MADQQELLDAALSRVTEDRLRDAICAMVAIPSPTGSEAELAHWLAARLGAAGLDAHAQHIDADQANAVGRLRGSGAGPDLMLYAPIDTLTTGDATLDVPWIGPHLRADMLPDPVVDGPFVTGLGASNPKGHAACVLVVAEALAEAAAELGVERAGDLVVGFGAGGMPTNAIDADVGGWKPTKEAGRVGPGGWKPTKEAGRVERSRANTGHGVGCSFLLERGWYTDAAVIAKPGDFVAYDEVGLCWFEIVVPGIHTYVGSRHRLPYRNPIVDAAAVVPRLEAWLAEYAIRHRTETACPQGVIGSIAGGWERMLAVTPAVCRLRLDVRITPESTPMQVKRELAAFVAELSAELGLDLRVELVNAIPGTRTEPDSWVVGATIAAWEQTAHQPHTPIPDNSGATDANILRARGVPTARVGMPKVSPTELGDEVDFSRGMNTVDVRAMRRLAEVLLRVAITGLKEDA